MTHLDGIDFPIHKLILRCGSLKPLPRQLHGIPGVVNVGKYLEGYHCRDVLCHFINGTKVVDDLVSETQRPV